MVPCRAGPLTPNPWCMYKERQDAHRSYAADHEDADAEAVYTPIRTSAAASLGRASSGTSADLLSPFFVSGGMPTAAGRGAFTTHVRGPWPIGKKLPDEAAAFINRARANSAPAPRFPSPTRAETFFQKKNVARPGTDLFTGSAAENADPRSLRVRALPRRGASAAAVVDVVLVLRRGVAGAGLEHGRHDWSMA